MLERKLLAIGELLDSECERAKLLMLLSYGHVSHDLNRNEIVQLELKILDNFFILLLLGPLSIHCEVLLQS